MANSERFNMLQILTVFLLWSDLVINCLEIVLYTTHILELYGGLWIKFGVLFYLIWSICAVMASGTGIYGIEKHFPDTLIRTVQYFLCSAALKGISTVLLVIFPANDPGFGIAVTYASSGPLLLTLMDRFTKSYQSLPIALAHIITIVFLLCMALLVKRYRNAASKRQINFEGVPRQHDDIPMR